MRMKEFKLNRYINKIKENEFFAGVIEIYIAFKLLNINIVINLLLKNIENNILVEIKELNIEINLF